MPWSFLIVPLFLCFCAFCGHSRQRSRCRILQTPRIKAIQERLIVVIPVIQQRPLLSIDGSAQSQANGSFPKGTGRLSEKSPAGQPPPHHRDDTPGSAGVPPACCPFGCRSVSLRCCSRPTCRREPHGPGRSRGRAPLPVDSGEGDGRSCGRICAGGTPALPGGLPPMAWSHPRDKSAEAFWRQLSLKEVHLSWCLFVFIGGSSSLTNGCFSSE